jgi:hypothetical protein
VFLLSLLVRCHPIMAWVLLLLVATWLAAGNLECRTHLLVLLLACAGCSTSTCALCAGSEDTSLLPG